MGRTALSGAVGVFAALGFGAGSQAGPQGPTAAPGVTNAPGVTTQGTTTDVTLKQSRTIIDWKSFQLDKGETLNFLFNDKNWIVLNRTPGVAVVNGSLNGCVVTCGTVGGNVWIYGGEGVIFGPNARVNVGTLLATTSPLASELDFLSGKASGLTFTGGQDLAAIRVQAGAEIAAHGGALALVAPQVETDAGSTVSATGTATIAAAKAVTVHFDASAGGNLDLIDFQLPASALEDGTVSATPLAVNGAVSGGSVVLAAVSRPSVLNALISVGGAVTATGAQAGEGGSIVLTGSGGATKADVSGSLVAHGGKVDVTATDVALEGTIDVSAPDGGGAVRLGGGSRGQDRTIANASTVTVGAGAVIDASATARGDGGSVTVWSDKATDFAGLILAKGGPGGGNGGAAEVSGGWLNYAGTTDLRAPLGATGGLLLDPDDIIIQAASTPAPTGTLTNPPPSTVAKTNVPGSSTFTVSQINSSLALADVTISTVDAANTTGAGTISFPDAATYAFTGSGKLTFNAESTISFGGATTIVHAGNTGGLVLDAGAAFSLNGATVQTTLAGGAPLTISAPRITVDGVLGTTGSGGVLTLTATGTGATDGIASTAAGQITTQTLDASAAGAAGIDLRLGTEAVAQLGAITTTGTNGGFAISDTTSLALTGVVSLNGAGVLNLVTSSGAISQNTGVGVSVAAGSVTGQAPGGFSLNNSLNTFTGVGAVSATGATADVTLVSGGAVTVSGAVQAGRDATVTGSSLTVTGTGGVAGARNLNLTASAATGDLVIGGAVSANATTGTATLSAGRHTTETFAGPPVATGTITAGTLSLTTGDADLTGSNAVAKILTLSGVTGDVSFTDGQALEFAAGFPVLTPLPGNLTLKTTAGGLTLDALVATGSSLDLETAGALSTQGIAVVGDYTVKAASFTTPSATLTPTLGLTSGFSIEQTTGDFALSSIGTPTVAGALVVKADAGTITAGANLQGASVAVTGKAVTVDKLTATAGDISVTATAGAVTLQNTVSTGGPTDGHTITLKSTGGGLSQTGGVLAAQTLDAQGDGVVSLGLDNTVGGLTHLTSNGALTFRDDVTALTISNASTGATGGLLTLRNSGSLTLSNLSIGTAGASLTSDTDAVLVSDALTLGGGTTTVHAATTATFDGAVNGPGALNVQAPAATFASTVGATTRVASLTTAGTASLGGNVSTGAGGLVLGGLATIAGATTLDSHGVTTLAGVDSATSTARALTIASTGAFSSSAAVGQTNGLSSLSLTAPSASFTGSNKVASLGVDLSSGANGAGFSFTNTGGPLAVTGITTNNGSVSLTSGAGIALNGAVTLLPVTPNPALSAATLTLSAGGGITQLASADVIKAHTLSATSAGVLQLDGAANLVDLISVFSNGGSPSASAFKSGQSVEATSNVSVGGALTFTTTAGDLTTADVTAGGLLTLTAAGALDTTALQGTAATLSAGTTLTTNGVTATTGAISATTNTGAIATGALTATTATAGNIALTAGATLTAADTGGTIDTGVVTLGGSYTVEGTSHGATPFLGAQTLAPSFQGAVAHSFTITSHGDDFALSAIGTRTISGLFSISAPDGQVTDGVVPGGVLQGGAVTIAAKGMDVSNLTATGGLVNGDIALATSAGDLLAGGLQAARNAQLTTSGGKLELTGAATAGQTASLGAGGGQITQDPGALITAPKLVAVGDAGIALGEANVVGEVVQLADTAVAASATKGITFVTTQALALDTLGATSTNGDVAIQAASLALRGPVSAVNTSTGVRHTVTLSATGGVIDDDPDNDGAGGVAVITADTLVATGSAGVLLGTETHQIATRVTLGGGTGGVFLRNGSATSLQVGATPGVAGAQAGGTGGVHLINAGGLRLTGDVRVAAAAPVILAASGAAADITQDAGESVGALAGGGTLSASAGRDVVLSNAQNTYSAVSSVVTGRDALLASPDLAYVHDVEAGRDADVVGGPLTQVDVVTAGRAATVTSVATGLLTVDLVSAGTGNLTIQTDGALTLAAPLGGSPATACGAASLCAPGATQLTTLTAGVANGSLVTQGSSAFIDAGRLSVSGTRIDLSPASNLVAVAVSLAGRDGVALNDAVSGGLTVLSATEATTGAAGHGISVVNTGNIVLGVAGSPATPGNVQAGTNAGAARSDQAVTLASSAGAVTQVAGALKAGTLTATGFQGVSLQNGTNDVATIARLSDTGTGGAGAAYAGVGPLTVQQADSQRGNVTLSSTGDLTLSGPVQALGHVANQDVVTLKAGFGSTTGSVLGAGGAVTADVLTGSAAENLVLNNAGNVIGRLQDLTVGGTIATPGHALTVSDTSAFTLGGAIGGTNAAVTLSSAGAITQDAASGAVVTGATLQATGRDGLLFAGNNAVGTVVGLTDQEAGPVASYLGVLYTYGAGGVTVQNVNAGAGDLTIRPFGALTSGALTLTGALVADAPAQTVRQTVTLISNGAVTQTGGSVTAGNLTQGGVLTGASDGDFTLTSSTNAFDTLGALTVTGGNASLVDSRALTLTGPVSVHQGASPPALLSITAPTLVVPVGGAVDADNVTLTATATVAAPSAAITVAGSIRAGAATSVTGEVDLEAAHGPVVETADPGALITAQSLKVTAAGGVTLQALAGGADGTTQVLGIANTGSGDLLLTLPGSATFSGPVTNLAGAVTIAGPATGGPFDLTFTAPVHAGGDVQLTAPTGALAGTDVTSDSGALRLTGGTGVSFSGAAAAAGSATVQAGTGSASFGDLTAGGVIGVTADGDASFGGLHGGSDVGVTAGTPSRSGLISVTAPNAFTVAGNLTLQAQDFSPYALLPQFATGVTPPQTFTLTDTAGGLTYVTLNAPGDLTVTAQGTGTTAPISGGALTSDHGHIAVSGTSLALNGAVTATDAPVDMTPAIALTARTGAIGLSGLVDAGARTAALSAGGAVGETGNGAINAAALTVQSGGAITLDGPNGQGLTAMTATLANSGAGGVSFTDGAGVVTLTSVTTGGGDITLAGPTATTFNLPATLTSPGAISVDVPGGELDGGVVTAQGGALSLTGLRVTLTGAAQASAGLSVDAEGDVASLQTLTANGGDVSVRGGTLTTGDATASGGVTYDATGPVTAGRLTATGGALSLTGGSLSFTGASAGTDATLVSGGAASFNDLAAQGAVSITAGGALQASSVAANGGNAAIQAAGVQLATLAATNDVTVANTAGDLVLSTSATAGRDMTLTSVHGVTAATLTVGRDLSVAGAQSGTGVVTIGGLATGAAGDVAISGQDILLGAPAATSPGAANRLATGAATTLEVDATRDLGLNLTGPLAATRLTSGRNLTLAATGGDASAGVLSSGGALAATVTGGSARIGTLTLTGAGPATVSADTDVVLGQGFAGATLSIPSDLLVLTAGRDVTVAYPGAVSLAQATAGRDLLITSGAALDAQTLTATAGSATLQAASLNVATLGAGANVTATTTGGDLTLGTATAAQNLAATSSGALDAQTLTATAGSATLQAASLDVTTLNAGTNVTATTTGGDLTLGQATAGQDLAATSSGALNAQTLTATAGSATLQAASLDVTTLSAGTTAAVTTTGGDLTLGQATAGQDLAATSGGALKAQTLTATSGSATLQAASLDVTTLNAGTNVTATTTGGDLALGQATAGQDFSATSSGALTAQALTATAGSATLHAASLDVTTLNAGTDVATTTTGGDLTLGAVTGAHDVTATSSGALDVQTLTATAGSATLQAASADVTTLNAGTDVAATTTGDLTLGTATAGRNLAATAGGALNAQTLTATAGSAILQAASLDVATLAAGTDATAATTGGALTLGQATAGEDIAGTAAGLLQATTLTAARDITLVATAPSASPSSRRPAAAPGGSGGAPGDIVLGTATAGRNLKATAAGALGADTLMATAGSATLAATSIAVTTLSAGTDAALAAGGGDIDLGTATTGGDVTADAAGAFTAQTLVSGGSASAAATGAATIDAATVGGDLALTSRTADAALRTVTMTGAQAGGRTLTVTAAGEASIGRAADGGATGALNLADAAHTQVFVRSTGAGGRAARVDVTGDADLTQVSSASGDVLVRAGGAIVGTPTSGATLFQAAGALTATSAGDMTLGGVSSSGGAATLQSGGALTLATLNAGTTATLGSQGAMSVAALTSGGDAALTSQDALTATSATVGGAATLNSQKAMAVGALTAASAKLTSQDAIIADTVRTTGAATLDAATGLSVTTLLAAGTDATLTSGGAMSVATLTAGGGATLTSGDALTATSLTTGGAATLASQKAMSVGALQTGGDATLTSQDALGATTLTVGGVTTLTSQGALSLGALTSTGDATLTSQATASVDSLATSGAATLYAQGAATIGTSFTAATTATVRAADLALNGTLKAPTVVIASGSGTLNLGDKAGTGGLTLDDAEYGRITTPSLTLYAGDPAVAAGARGDVTVGDLTVDGARVKRLTILAGNAATVTITGRVGPSLSGSASAGDATDLVIGAAPGADHVAPAWTPKAILVEGGIGGPALGASPYTLTTPTFAIHSLELNALQKVLIGGGTILAPNDEGSFATKIGAAIDGVGTGNPINVINVTRGTPVGISPDVKDFNRNIVTAGTLTVRTDGYLVQQNTGSTGQQGGIFLTNPDKATTVITLGRITGAGAGGILVPNLIDISANFVSAAGTLITRQVAATSLSIDTSDISRSDAYRINGCTIGVAGTCTPLPNTISNIHIDKLAEGVQIANEDPPAIDDPTITGTGNEEIWRSPAPSCQPGPGRVCK